MEKEKRMEKESNIIVMENYYLKVNNGLLKYEGEYLNGKRHEKAKEYYDNDKLI